MMPAPSKSSATRMPDPRSPDQAESGMVTVIRNALSSKRWGRPPAGLGDGSPSGVAEGMGLAAGVGLGSGVGADVTNGVCGDDVVVAAGAPVAQPATRKA